MLGDGDLRVIVRDVFAGPVDLRADLNRNERVSAADLTAFERLASAP